MNQSKMSKLSLVVLNWIVLIIQKISSLNIPQEQFGPKEKAGPLQEFGLQKNLRPEGCWPKKPCQSQEDCGTDGICYISHEEPYLGKVRLLSKSVFLPKNTYLQGVPA